MSEPAAAETNPDTASKIDRPRSAVFTFFRRNVTPRLGTALAVWRLEAWLATPLAVLFLATLGRWPGALAQGLVMAACSALFLFLLDGERVMQDVRHLLSGRRWARRFLLPIAERRDRTGTLHRIIAVPGTVMLMGPFWRAVTYHLFRVPRSRAYALSVVGSIPHSLFWTGLVLGGVWEVAIKPALSGIA
jgi:hypothetical protein